jgi:ATP-binding cassette, subfamily B, multidrug efflux pump
VQARNPGNKPKDRPPERREPEPRGPGAHWMRKPERARDIRTTLLRIWRYLKRQKWSLAAAFLLVAVSSALGLLGPYLMGRAIDQGVIQADLQALASISVLMMLAYAANAATNYLQIYIMAGISQRTVRDIREDLFNHLQTLSLRFFDQQTHGELMSRLTNDVERISNVLTETVTQLFSSALNIIGVAVVMFMLNWRLALITMLTVPFMVAMTQVVSKRTRQGFRDQQKFLGDLNGIIEETVTGQRVVKAYVCEELAIGQFDGTNQELRGASTRAQIFAGLLGPLTNFVNNLGFAIVAGAGGWMVLRGLASVGTIASFIHYAREFTWPLNQLANLYNSIQSAIAGAERVFEIIDTQPELASAPDALPLADVRGEVDFEQVSFGYEQDVPVLKHVNLHAAPGATIALVGPTGAGKTTIVNLLTRFYDIDEGSIAIDGKDIRQLKLDDLRRQLGIVLQDTFLFASTVKENIRYGRLDATDEEVVAAARLANADTFIHRLPQGFDTPLSERGGNISQGQRQLLAIARAILANPSILILDEATSSVDTRTEKHIQEAMLRLMKGRTSFVIAHRLSTIREADRILVINGGEIIEQGNHQELLEAGGFYHNLYTSQFKGQLQLSPELSGSEGQRLSLSRSS